MKFYLKVTTYSSTTTLGKNLAREVELKYDRSLVDSDDVNSIFSFIKRCQVSVLAENRRLKPMAIRSHGFAAGNGFRIANSAYGATIWMTTAAGDRADGDNRPFTIHLEPVLKDYTDRKGGEK